MGERAGGGGGAQIETAQQIALAARFLELGPRRQPDVALQLLQAGVLLLQLLLTPQQFLVAQLERLGVFQTLLRINALAAGAVAGVRSDAQQNFSLRGRLGCLFSAQGAASGGRRQVLAPRLQTRRAGGGHERRLGAGAWGRRGRHFAALRKLGWFVVVAHRAHRRVRVGAARVRVQSAQRATAASGGGRLGRRGTSERLQFV